MSRDSAFAAVCANALPHSRKTTKVQYRYLMGSSSIDFRADALHQLRVFCVLASDFCIEFLGRVHPGLDPARVAQLIPYIREHQPLVHYGAQASETGLRSAR